MVGTTLGHYSVIGKLGAGGMGEVYRAVDATLGREVALKVVSPDVARDPERLARFAREARVVAALNHPNIVTIFSVEEADGIHFLTMELIEGASLADSIPAGGLAIERLVAVGAALADALAAAHDKGIVHRDLKPANVMTTADGRVKVLDFGLAKEMRASDPVDATMTIAGRTDIGVVIGTPAYMSPEQVVGRPIDHRTDIFSLGVVLYQAATGRRPFVGATSIELASAILRDVPRPLDEIRSDIPVDLARLIGRCLEKDVERRVQTAREVARELRDGPRSAPLATQSVAVLPFANLSADKDQEYFSDGLSEEIINALARVRGLKVIARTSAFAFRKEQDIREIGRALGVQAIVQGSVRRAGARLRISAQLIGADDGAHLWSERFDREMTDVFELQDEIASAIASALSITLAGPPSDAPRHQPDVAAYEAFLKGRYCTYRLSPDAFVEAEREFARAAELDPHWAEPHAALGDLYYSLGFFGWRPLAEMVGRARDEAQRALALVPAHLMAQAVLGLIAGQHDYDWRQAADRFRSVLSSPQRPSSVNQLCAFYLISLGRFDAALDEIGLAIAADPLNSYWYSFRAMVNFSAGRHDDAVADALRALEFGDLYHAHTIIAFSLLWRGRLAEARESAEESFRRAPFNSMSAGVLGGLLQRCGETERAAQVIGAMKGAVSVGMTMYHVIAGDVDRALDSFEQAIRERRPNAPQIAFAAFMKPLRESPRWPALAKLMKLDG
jgi:serine/threonine protein kinase/tetratricopeptide (TPR) repeat protein